MHVFYTPDIQGTEYVLNELESKHCVQVLRMGTGDQVLLLDGRGGKYQARIREANRRAVALTIESHSMATGRPFKLHIAVAPTKNIDRLEWFLEKATEIGMDVCTPLICERSERRVLKHDRLLKVITAAVKQSMAEFHPQLSAETTFQNFMSNPGLPEHKFIAHCEDQDKAFIEDLLPKAADCLVLIGPEGDFSPTEIKLALQSGFKPITLGDTRLRTETAALAACFEANFVNR